MPSIPISRDRSPVAVLTSPTTDIPLGENNIRLHDYLDDKFQAASDLKNVNVILANVEKQKKELEQQLNDVKVQLAESKKANNSHSSSVLEKARDFAQRQEEVNRRLMELTSSKDPQEALERLKGPMEKLRRVKLAEGYIELLKEVNDLAIDARQHLPGDPKEALKPYTQLKELALSLKRLQDPAEGAGTHLVNYVEHASTELWASMTKIMTDDFEAILNAVNWPNEAKDVDRKWMDSFEKLLDLQFPEIDAAREPLILLPIGVLAKPFIQQFKFNFSSEKPTSQPNQVGDHVFSWVIGLVRKWEPFLRRNVAPILAAHFQHNALAGNSLYVDPVSALITALLPVVKEKVDSVMEPISRNPSLLSKFMGQLLAFDENIRAEFNYDGGNLEYGWKGMSWQVMDIWFDKWLQVEKAFALQRYEEIIKSPDSGLIDYDSVAPGSTKPTFGAIQVVDLLASVTLSYNKLRRFSHKMRFLIEIQAEMFDQYQGRLSESLDVYQAMTSTIGRTIHGVTKEQQAGLEGIRGIESLCKVYGSSEHVIDALKKWGNQDFFVELWDQLQDRARKTGEDENLAGSMSYTEVKESTSDAVGSLEGGGCLFDITLKGYNNLRHKSSGLLVQAIKYSYPPLLRQYLKSHFTTVGGDARTISSELDQPLRTMKESFQFLDKALGQSEYRRICREAFASLQDLLWNEVLIGKDFTTFGAARLARDAGAFERLTPDHRLKMSKLNEGITLLNLPTEIEEGGGISLEEAVNAIFAAAPEADKMLEKLGLRDISKLEARAILKRRREAML